jgi:excisionase family DNA binding protein
MAFTLDREAAADRLWVSSRTIDRHIQAGRIRTRRIGKKMFLEDEDIESLRNLDPARREEDYVVIMDDKKMPPKHELLHSRESNHTIAVSAPDNTAVTELVRLYEETRNIISQKDEIIQDLSYRLGKTEMELKNTIPLVDYNKATFLLESAKTKWTEDADRLAHTVETLEKEISKRNNAIISIALLFVLVLVFSVVFFLFSPRI